MGALHASGNQPFLRASTPGTQHHSQKPWPWTGGTSAARCPPTLPPSVALAYSHPAPPPRGLSISQNCGGQGASLSPGGRTMPRQDLWDSLTSQCPGSPRGVTAGTHGRVWGTSSQDPGVPCLALLPRIASAPPPELGVLEGWEAAPGVPQPCFLPQT